MTEDQEREAFLAWHNNRRNGITNLWTAWQARAALAAQAAPAGAPEETVESVAVVKQDGSLDWLIEGGQAALEPGETLMICAERLTDDTGSGTVYIAARQQESAR